MLTTWTKQIIEDRIETLRQDQQELLNYYFERIGKKATQIAFKKFGFIDREEYDDELAKALEALRASLAEIGLTHISSLDFEHPATSWEGKMKGPSSQAPDKYSGDRPPEENVQSVPQVQTA